MPLKVPFKHPDTTLVLSCNVNQLIYLALYVYFFLFVWQFGSGLLQVLKWTYEVAPQAIETPM